jgi:hypothetical protein
MMPHAASHLSRRTFVISSTRTRQALAAFLLCGGMAASAATAAQADDPPPLHLLVQRADGATDSWPLGEIRKLTLDGTSFVLATRTGPTVIYGFDALRGLTTDAPLLGVDPGLGTARTEAGVHLLQNRPNPVSRVTTISFDLPSRDHASVELFDVSGRRLRTLVDAELPAGRHDIVWDGADARGRRVGAGVYFYRLHAAGVDRTRRIVVLP